MVLLIRRTVRPRGYASESSLAAALPAERRVLARQGWVGENRSLFEHPAERVSAEESVECLVLNGELNNNDRRPVHSTLNIYN